MKIEIVSNYVNEYDVTIRMDSVYSFETVGRIIGRIHEARDNDWNAVEPVTVYQEAPPREPFYDGDTICKAIRAVADSGDKIAALRLYRYLMPGTGLRDAKDEVERIMSGTTV